MDTQEHLHTEKTTSKSMSFTETLLNNTPDIIYIYDIVTGKNVYSNQGIGTVIGYSVEEIQAFGDTVLAQTMHPDDFQTYLDETLPLYQQLADKELIKHEYRVRHKQGHWRWMYARESIFLRQEDGSPQQIFGVVTDITDRKTAERELRYLRNYLSNIINSMPSVLIGVDREGRVTQWNKTIEINTGTVIQLTRPKGYTPEQGAMFEVHFRKSRGLHGDEVKPFEARLATGEDGFTWQLKTLEESTIDKVGKLLDEGYSQKDISEELQISKGYCSKLGMKLVETIGCNQWSCLQSTGNRQGNIRKFSMETLEGKEFPGGTHENSRHCRHPWLP